MNESPSRPELAASDWSRIGQSLARSYRVRAPMVLLLALVPFYVLIPEFIPPGTRFVLELAFDRALPLVPSWAIVYGALYLFLILLPFVVVRQDELVRRMAYEPGWPWWSINLVAKAEAGGFDAGVCAQGNRNTERAAARRARGHLYCMVPNTEKLSNIGCRQ